jgi:hypothetical protein
VLTSNDCELCHNTITWLGATFDHSTVTTSCSSCHGGDLPLGHFVSADDCSECHGTARWSPSTFSHSTPNYPGTHSGNLDCTACHPSNNETVVWDRADLSPDCGGCHASDWPGKHKGRSLSELRDCASACHIDGPGVEHRVGDRKWN